MFEVMLGALLIFTLRIVDVSFGIIRILMVMRGHKFYAWLSGFFSALVFVIAIQRVASDLGNWANIIGYSAGFATGNVVGMFIEEKLAVGFGHIQIISNHPNINLVGILRESGFAVTEFEGHGRDGEVDVLMMSVPRKKVATVRKITMETDPSAFITVENIHPINRGFWRK